MREADNLTTFMCRMAWKSGSLNLLEPSGPHRDCYGTPLRFIMYVFVGHLTKPFTCKIFAASSDKTIMNGEHIWTPRPNAVSIRAFACGN